MKSLPEYIKEGLLGDDIRQLFRKQHVKVPKSIKKHVIPAPILIDWEDVFEKCWDNIVERGYPYEESVFWKRWGELIRALNERNIQQTDFLTWLKTVYVDKRAMDVIVDALFEEEETDYIDEFIDWYKAETKR